MLRPDKLQESGDPNANWKLLEGPGRRIDWNLGAVPDDFSLPLRNRDIEARPPREKPKKENH